MAPEVYASKEYSPEKADIWCLAVMLFMMLVGAPPYECPNPTNPAYRFIISGRLRDVLSHWKRLPLVSADALDVMEKIFKPENERISMEELRSHKYVGLPSLTSKVEVDTSTVSLSTKDKEAKDQKQVTTGKDKTLAIKSEAIPWVDTKEAQRMAHLLRGAVGVDSIRTFVNTIEKTIESAHTRPHSAIETGENVKHGENAKHGENPKAEGVTDEGHHGVTSECMEELKKLLQLAKDALAINAP